MKDYIEKALRTNAGSEKAIKRMNDDKIVDMLHGAMGISTEANEILDVLKKHIFYGKEIDELDLALECSDCLWYLAIILNRLGYDFETIMKMNIEKLQKRYPDKFNEDKAINKNINEELKHFEG